ncbi:MAG: nuclear transport factor 2 family protein [Gammaproteobacteria bacterium]
MSIEDNRRIALRYLELISAGDIDGAFALVADDAVWTVPGRSAIAARLAKTQVRAALEAVITASVSGMRIWPIATTAEGDRVAVQAESQVTLRNGGEYANCYHILLVIRGGLIREGFEYFDTLHAAQALAGVLPGT